MIYFSRNYGPAEIIMQLYSTILLDIERPNRNLIGVNGMDCMMAVSLNGVPSFYRKALGQR